MTDVLLVLITVVFFGVATLLVRVCDSIIGPDEEDLDGVGEPTVVGSGEADGTDEPVLTGAAS